MKKRKQQAIARPGGSSILLYAVPVIFIALITWVIWPTKVAKHPVASANFKTPIDQPLVLAWYGDVQHLLAQRFLAMVTVAADPNAPENSQMLPALKSRLQWIYLEQSQHRLEAICAKYITNSDGKPIAKLPFMATKYDDNGMPSIVVLGPTIYAGISENGGTLPAVVPQVWKNYFAISLAHEKIHLDNIEFMRRKNPSHEEVLREELRTWVETDLEIAGPMRKLGEPLHRDLISADDIIRRCGNKLPCAELRNFLETMY